MAESRQDPALGIYVLDCFSTAESRQRLHSSSESQSEQGRARQYPKVNPKKEELF
jgi:hypothetical protein